MTAPVRRLAVHSSNTPTPAWAAWCRAVEVRQEWLAHGLATEPADRGATEASLARIYARLGRARPDVIWTRSPRAALPHLAGLPTHDDLYRWITGRRPPGRPPLASDLAASVSHLRSCLDDGLTAPGFDRPPPKRTKGEPWPRLPAEQALEWGVPFLEVLRQGVRDVLRASLVRHLAMPIRAALGADRATPVPVCWYGQQDASWLAYFDAGHRLGMAAYTGSDQAHLDDWATLARGGGWWWPGESTCIVVERPATVHTEPVPGAWHGEVRPRRDGIEFRDGWRPLSTVDLR